MSDRLDRVLSNYLKANASNIDEVLDIFLKDFLSDIKRLTNRRIVKLSNESIDIKDRLLKIEINYVKNFIDDYEEAMAHNMLLYADLAKQWSTLKSVEILNKLIKKTESFKNEIDDYFLKVSEIATQIIDNFIFLQKKYDFNNVDNFEIEKFKDQLQKITKMNYSNFIKYLKEESFQ